MELNNLKNLQANDGPLTFNILATNPIQINQKFVIKLTEHYKNFTKDVKDSCKVLHLSSEWNFDEMLALLDGFNSKDYPNIFIFIIDNKNFKLREHFQDDMEHLKNLKDKLLKFGKSRPLILQLTSEDEKMTEIYLKEESSKQFFAIDQKQKQFEEKKDFPTFLCKLLSRGFKNFYIEMITLLPKVQNSSLILRFILTLDINKIFLEWMILKIAERGSKTELFALLDVSFESGGRALNLKSQNYLSNLIKEHDQLEENLSKDNLENSSKLDSEEEEEEKEQGEGRSSVLFKAIEYENIEVVDFLITYWTHLIQQLPFDHQVLISTTAFQKNQLDVLYDLLNISDYPFPDNFDKIQDQIENENIFKTITERFEFNSMIERENFKNIEKLIEKRRNLKLMYNIENIPALVYAVNANKFKVFYFLKSFGFEGIDCEEALEDLNEKQKKEALKQATEQRKSNVIGSLSDKNKPAEQLLTRSYIHNRKINEEQENKYREYIRKWFCQIQLIAPEMINVASSCTDLKIIFDFESDTVENVSLSGSNSTGSMYPVSKSIFVAAKLLEKEQQIKGVLAHELCHYVMHLVYENNENPYYEYDSDEIFAEIVKVINKWLTYDNHGPDDECNGIISSVFKLYSSKDFHPELIVRVVQILAEFDIDPEKTKYLRDKYCNLFAFWNIHVIPKLKSFDLEMKNSIRKMNKRFQLLDALKRKKIKLSFVGNQEILKFQKRVIILTNVPKLLLNNIYQQLQNNCKNQLDVQNIFVDLQKLKLLINEFNELLDLSPKINIFIDCSKENNTNLVELNLKTESNLIFVASSQKQKNEIEKWISSKNMKPIKSEINYKWDFLNDESKLTLIQTKMNFQGRDYTLMELFKKDMNTNESDIFKKKSYLDQFSEIVDDKLLNSLVNGSKIIIRTNSFNDLNENHLELLYKQRTLKKQRCRELSDEELYSRQPVEKNIEISQEQLLLEVKGKKIILLSDKAGNGKSWMMLNIAKVLQEQNPTKWIVYIDLKKFIDVLKVESASPDFLSFILDKVIKPETKLERKVFSELYKIGKVCIIFDGYDEVAPNCTDFVKDLGKKLTFNEGNQLWIATRDYFEDEIKTLFSLDFIYKLVEFNEERGINLIAESWMLNDFNDSIIKIASKENFDEHIKNSTKFKEYRKLAKQIVEKISISENISLQFPLFFQMIADGYRNEKDVSDLNISTIFEKFVQFLFTRWSTGKGKIRFQAYRKGLSYNLNFWGIHQFLAIKTLFEPLIKELFSKNDGSNWTEIEIIACGLMCKSDGEFYFIHETLRDYFIAHKFANSFENNLVTLPVMEQFIQILVNENFGIIRMFLNDFIKSITLTEENVKQLKESICNVQNFIAIFKNIGSLENLADFVILILKTGENTTLITILKESIKIIISNSKNSKVFQKLQDFIFDSLNIIDLKSLIRKENIFQEIVGSGLDVEVFVNIVEKTNNKFNNEFVQNILTLSGAETTKKGNIFYYLCESPKLSARKFRKIIIIMRRYFDDLAILNLMKNCNEVEENILQVCVKAANSSNLQILWNELENLLLTQYDSETLISCVKQKSNTLNNILHCVSKSLQLENHKIVWEIFQKVIDNQNELKDFILQKNRKNNNFIHELVSVNNDPLIIEFTFKKLIEITCFSSRNVLYLKGQRTRNLLQIVAFSSNNIKVFEILWKHYRNANESDVDFLKFLKETDGNGQNILNIIAEYSTKDIFEFVIKEMEKLTYLNINEEIRKMLSNLDKKSRNIFQSAAYGNNSHEMHKYLRDTFGKYFETTDILHHVLHINSQGQNLVYIAFCNNSVDVVNTVWEVIETAHDHNVSKIKQYLIKNYENLVKASIINTCDKDNIFKYIQDLFTKYKVKKNTLIDYFTVESAFGICVGILIVFVMNKLN